MISLLSFSIIVLAFGTLAMASAQTPTTISPPAAPTSGLKFLDQKAYIYTVPPLEVQQQQQGNGTIESVITAGVGSAIAYFTASRRADIKHKENSAEILRGKEVNKELARVTYGMNPEQAAKIDDAPLVKQEVLAEDAATYGQKVANK